MEIKQHPQHPPMYSAAFQTLYSKVNPISCTSAARLSEIEMYLFFELQSWINEQRVEVYEAYNKARSTIILVCKENFRRSEEARIVLEAARSIPQPPDMKP